MSNELTNQTKWRSCQPGELQLLAQRRLAAERRAFLMRSGGIIGSAVLMIGGVYVGYSAMRPMEEPTFGGIVCSKLRAIASEYARGQLSSELRQQISTHLSLCESCQTYMKNMKMPAGMKQS